VAWEARKISRSGKVEPEKSMKSYNMCFSDFDGLGVYKRKSKVGMIWYDKY